MEYAKDEIFTIKYERTRNKRISRIMKFFKRYKVLTTISILGLALSIADTILIISFFEMLSTI